ncbi:MAG: LysE family translocator [Epsilonproteobacteria bacterium]|nr:LysE family translocator [Campylobacterota bacterium]
MTDYIILFAVGFIAALTPGPDMFYILRHSVCYGKDTALRAVWGILAGNLVYLSLVGFGISQIGENPLFQFVVGVFGGVYLLRIAAAVYKENAEFDPTCEIKKNVFKEALIINLSNPKAMIFFTVILTPFLTKNVVLSLFSLFLGIAGAFLLLAFGGSRFEVKNLEVINKIAAVLFLFFAIKLLYTAFLVYKGM